MSSVTSATRWLADRSVRVRVLSLVVTAGAVLAFFGVMSVQALQETGRQSELLVADNEATRAALLADMMHDGIRGDVVLALMFSADQERYDAAAAALTEHSAVIHEQLATVAEADLGPEVAEAVESVLPAAQAYTTAAAAAVDLAGSDIGAAREAYPEFETAFEGLEETLPLVGDAISAHAEQTEQRIADQRSSAVRQLVLVALGGLLLMSALGWAVVGSVVRPLRKVSALLERIAEGDLTGRADVSSRDELGDMARRANLATERLREVIGAVDQNAVTLASASEELSSVSGQMSGSAQESASQAGLVSAAAEQVSRNVQTVAAGTEEMSASIREIAQNASNAAGVAAQAVGVAQATNAAVEKLGESSSEVGNVIKVINSIAEQTNLLALNATIEAARAGEAGKGFAVVATEVKELAQETSKATEDIGRRIEAIQSDTNAAVAAIAEISGIIAQINDTQTTIASAVEEQTATTNEMSRNVAEAATGSTDIAENITTVASSADDTRAAASSTNEAADELARIAAELQQLVGQFQH